MEKFIHIRGLKFVEHTVFCVSENGQKTFFDPIHQKTCALSSGQQVKRSIMTAIASEFGQSMPVTTFTKKVTINKDGNKKIGEGHIITEPDIKNSYHLVGGFWKSVANEKGDSVSRRSPLKISGMTPIHPLLATVYKEDISHNRKNTENTFIKFIYGSKNDEAPRGKNGQEVPKEELDEILKAVDKKMTDYSPTQFIKDQKRTSGLFKFDIEIDLRKLFAINLSETDPEIYPEEIEHLKENGWKEIEYDFGKALVAPKEIRDKIGRAVAKGIMKWKIDSNQSTTYSPMETMAMIISNEATHITSAIRGELIDDDKAKLIVDDSIEKVFCSDSLKAIILYRKKSNDIKDAENYIFEKIMEFDFENQK